MKNSSSSGSGGIALVISLLLFLGSASKLFGTVPILQSADLKSFKDVHRLIIVFPGDNKKEEAFLEQWDSTDVHARMNRRSLLVVQVTNRQVIHDLREDRAPKESGFRIWLIGMDGHLLFSTSDEVEAWEIFNRIDELPGRKAEIQRYNDWVAGHRTSP